MRIGLVALMTVVGAGTAATAQQRELDAHEHGVGQLNIAFEGGSVVMELEAPGADIVGFEHRAESVEDSATIDEAIAVLAKPLELVAFPEEAQCVVTSANVVLEEEEEHGKEMHGDDDDAHAADGHSDEGGHAEHDEHAEEARSHTEFHAEYKMQCAQPSSVTQIDFPYFETFANARELEVQIVTDKGANRFEVERDDPRIDLTGMM